MNNMTEATTPAARPTPAEINETIHYTTFLAYQLDSRVADGASASRSYAAWVAECAAAGVTVRGAYDLTALRADAALLLWLHADTAEQLQRATHAFARTEFGANFSPTWSGMGIHRPAEFNRSHVPAFMQGYAPKTWLCFYPFVRSYEWYLLPEAERSEMLREHGMAGHTYKGVQSNTVSSFALGDYEWLLALESEDLHEIVDMMRTLRNTEARRHVREEVPFFTGSILDANLIGETFA
jgi:hydrogen peroxide-dependent heme synthase